MITLQPALDRLEHAGLVRQATLYPDLEYLFRHALVQDAAYGSLLRADRRRLHAQVGLVLEHLYPDSRRELAPLLATHFLEAKETAKALHYLRLAAQTALKSYANAEAAHYYRAALPLIGDPREQAELHAGLAEALQGQGQFTEALEQWQAAATLYAGLGDTDNQARTLAQRARTFSEAGDQPAYRETAEDGVRTLAGAPPSAGLAALLHEAARSNLFNNLDDAVTAAYCRQALAMARAVGSVVVEAETLATLFIVDSSPSAERRAIVERALALAEATGLLKTAARAHLNLAVSFLYEDGIMADARPHFRRAVDLAAHQGNTSQQVYYLNAFTNFELTYGNLDSAEALLVEARALLRYLPMSSRGTYEQQKNEATLLWGRGALEAARDRLLVILAADRQTGIGVNLVDTMQMLGVIFYDLGDLAQARQLMEEALALMQSMAAMYSVAGRAILAAIQARQGHLTQAVATLQEAQQSSDSLVLKDMRMLLALFVARVATLCEPRSVALIRWEEARAQADQGGFPWRGAQIRREWAACLAAGDDPRERAAANRLLEEAAVTFEALGAPYYADKARAERAALGMVS